MVRLGRLLVASLAAFGLGAATSAGAEAELPRLSLDPAGVTVSGISAGGYMAGQFQVSWSTLVHGAGFFAAGPWNCAHDSLSRAFGECLARATSAPDSAELVAMARTAAAAHSIDPLDALARTRVYALHGTADDQVATAVSDALVEFYRAFVPANQIRYRSDVAVAHGIPTLAAGGPCGITAAPYLNACGIDAVGEMLSFLYPGLAAPDAAARARATRATGLRRFAQASYDGAGDLAASGFLYVPGRCTHGTPCRLHIAFHGCRQGEEFVGLAFVRDAGYNAWAEANDLVILYPQLARSLLAPLNPQGCWDWWGYRDAGYATQAGSQVRAVRGMVRALGGF
jgi:poly(3-hydroxybutyrate) depolymerase